jgi:predicted dehydrogenase
LPNVLWIGYREKANKLMIKDPFTVDNSVKQYARYPGGHEEGFADSHTQCNRSIYEYIRDGKFKNREKADFATFRNGYESQLICDAIFESNQKKEWVNVDY